MTTNDERLLKLIRLDRWLQRRNPLWLCMEAAALVIGFACLEELLAGLLLEGFPPDSACLMVDGFAGCLDTTGLSPIPVVWGWVAGVLLVVSVEFIQWRCQHESGLRRPPSHKSHPKCSSALWGANVLMSDISCRTITDKSPTPRAGPGILT